MFSKSKIAIVLATASLLLSTNIGTYIVSADTTANDTTTSDTDTTVSTATNDLDSPNRTTTTTNATAKDNIDTAAVKAAMLSELNRLRSQNGLTQLTSVDVLNNYAQVRTDSFISTGNIDNHAGWKSINMYPYNYTAEENISQMPFSMIGTTNPTAIAQKVTHEFYSETYDSEPNYGHRKNMLNPYINYVGIGVSVSSTGMVYFSQEMGNDQAAYSKYDPADVNKYYLTKYNDYANVSKYDLADTKKTSADYTSRDDYETADIRGGVTTKDYLTPLYDRYGNKSDELQLSPNSDWLSDVIGIINGKYYYHVSTNGFVSADDVLPWASFLYGYSITTTGVTKVYDNSGNYTGKTVEPNSRWIVDRRAVNPITQAKMYRIGTNAWIQKD